MPMRKLAWGLMTALALIIAAYAITILFVPSLRPPFLQERFLIIPLAAILHLGASGVALLVGPLQHNSAIRDQYPNFHRWIGRTYVVAVLFGGAG